MSAPALIPYLEAVRLDLRACCDALDDAESVRNFLRNLHDALPAEILAWHCYAEDRIEMSPAYRALSDDAKRAVQWALSPMSSRLVCRSGLPIDTAHLQTAAEFCRMGRDSVSESDDAWAALENAYNELRGAIKDREDEDEALAAYQEDRYTRGTEAWLEAESVAPQNRDVISAAPELYEALAECAERLAIHMQHTEDLAAHMKACTALAKARGE